MEIYFNSQYTFGLFFLCIVIAGIFSIVLYRKAKKDFQLPTGQIYLFGLLRFFSVFLIAALILGLAVQQTRYSKQKPELIIGIDNSESLKGFRDEITAVVDKLKNDLKNYNPEILLFDSQMQRSEKLSSDGKRSNYSYFFDEINRNFLPANIGAVLLLGDGLFNAGSDPVFVSASLSYPVYTLGIGDSAVHADAAIRNVTTNKTAYLENNFPVEIDLGFAKAAGQTVKLTIQQANQVVFSKAIQIQTDDFFITERLNLKPVQEGILKYVIRLDEVDGDQNMANNIHEFSIDVISEKQKILVLAYGPHPDIAAIIAALKDKKNYSFEVLTGFKEAIEFSDYDLIIVHQLPCENIRYPDLLDKLEQSHRPFLYILGRKTSLTDFNHLQTGVEFQANNGFDPIKARINDRFSLFNFGQNEVQILQNLPPLQAPFGDVATDPLAEVFAFQTIQSVATARPLIIFGKIEGQKRGFILGEGLWRWRMHDYLLEHSHHSFDTFVRKSVNYLILKPNEDNFNLYYQNEYAEDVPVVMQAELFNDSNEPVNSPEVEIETENETGQKYQAIFDKTNNKYQLNMGRLPAGQYSFSAHTKLNGTKYSETGRFSITRIQVELVKTKADFQALSQIAIKTGGKFFLPNNTEALVKHLKENPKLQTKQVEQQVYQEFLSMKWIFFLILFLLALEWFLRKYTGIY